MVFKEGIDPDIEARVKEERLKALFEIQEECIEAGLSSEDAGLLVNLKAAQWNAERDGRALEKEEMQRIEALELKLETAKKEKKE